MDRSQEITESVEQRLWTAGRGNDQRKKGFGLQAVGITEEKRRWTAGR